MLLDKDWLIRSVSERAGEGEPLVRLGVAVVDRANHHKVLDEVVDHFVAEARAAGVTWEQIGDLFGITRQAAHARYAAATTALEVPDQPLTKGFRVWSHEARSVLTGVPEAARERGGAEGTVADLLLALRRTSGPAAELLADAGVDERALLAAAAPDDSEQPAHGHLPWSADLRAVFAAAEPLAQDAGRLVEPLDLLAATLEPGSIGADLVADCGADAAALRAAAKIQPQTQ